jgi:hypothetical protein
MSDEEKTADPLHITEEMRKAGVLALLETELKSGTESDIVERVYRAMVRARAQGSSDHPVPIRCESRAV